MVAPLAVNRKAATNGHKLRKRVTFVITQELDDLLELFCNSTDSLKNDIAEEAIAQLLADRRRELEQALRKNHAALDHLPAARSRPSRRARTASA